MAIFCRYKFKCSAAADFCFSGAQRITKLERETEHLQRAEEALVVATGALRELDAPVESSTGLGSNGAEHQSRCVTVANQPVLTQAPRRHGRARSAGLRGQATWPS